MEKVLEWRANITGNPQFLRDLGTGVCYCHMNHCGGILDYVYGYYWMCRQCRLWYQVIKVKA